jgi:hypothetical protein
MASPGGMLDSTRHGPLQKGKGCKDIPCSLFFKYNNS